MLSNLSVKILYDAQREILLYQIYEIVECLIISWNHAIKASSTMMHIHIFINEFRTNSEHGPHWLKAYMFTCAERIYKSWDSTLLLWFTFSRSHFLPHVSLLFTLSDALPILVHVIVRCVLRKWLLSLNEYTRKPKWYHYLAWQRKSAK